MKFDIIKENKMNDNQIRKEISDKIDEITEEYGVRIIWGCMASDKSRILSCVSGPKKIAPSDMVDMLEVSARMNQYMRERTLDMVNDRYGFEVNIKKQDE